jgi:hypothetical protein
MNERSVAPDSPSMWKVFLRRLPVLIVIGAGIWLLKGGNGFPSSRQIIWELPSEPPAITELDIQIADSRGTLVKRDQFFFHGTPQREVTQKARLVAGDYPARVFVRRESDGPEEQIATMIHVANEETIVVWLRR